MGLEPARRVRLSEEVAAQLRAAIEAGEYPAGAKLPTEGALSASLGVGRTSVREAVRALVAEGMVESRQGSGVYATGRVGLSGRLSTAALVEVFQARCAVEAYAAELACAARDEADLAALLDALAERDRLPPGSRAYAEQDLAFHRALVAASGNAVLVEIFQALEPRLAAAFVESRFVERADPARTRAHDEAHHAIIVTVRERRVAEAVRLTRFLQEGAIALLQA
jgi:GntR family transcriptional regulator, transcriptional repressor for pyruvate dehydrogenase complex